MKRKIICILVMTLLIVTALPSISGNFIKNENFVDNTNEKNNSEKATHTVLGEFGTATWGLFPIYAHAALKELYAEGQLDFYYVSLIYDVNPVADSYVHDYYNFMVFPILWWDGGYKVDAGAGSTQDAKDKYIASINSCLEKPVYDIDIELVVDWLGGTEMQIDYTIYNNEPGKYDGTVKVYIIENESSEGWEDADGQIYTMAFLDWAFYEEISIPAGETYSNTTTWDGESNGYPNITEDNMILIAAVFNDEWHQGYSNPPTGAPFDAYYADETAAVTPKLSNPPNKPSITGPTGGAVGTEYEYTFVTTDPDEDNVSYYIEWGDDQVEEWIGPYASGEEVTVSHTWSEQGTYTIRAKAKDIYGVESEWSEPLTVTISNPPDAPNIDGTKIGKVGTSYNYTFTSIDPDNDDIAEYIVNWGDGPDETLEGPFASGSPATASHTWTSQGTYTIKAKAKDIYGAESPEGTLTVTMPRNKAINILFLRLLENHPFLFKLLQLLFQRLGLQ